MNRRHNHENVIVVCLFALAIVVFMAMIGLPLYHYVHHVVFNINASLKG